MNQDKIGKFIAERRKEKNMTQEQLAEKMGVTDKTISRWENGKTMPDYSLLKDLCNELDISVNEFLSGEKIENGKYINCAEENLIILTKQIEKRKKILKIIQRILLISVCVLFVFNIIFNSIYGDNWDKSNMLYMTYIIMSINFAIAVIMSFLNFDNKH
ncbi:MAG: helix-turn-helix transcriptional regulator [Bacilli bacterium]|nr:helix-turn-helix transcriptional regulator [Bacilli bacterium]